MDGTWLQIEPSQITAIYVTASAGALGGHIDTFALQGERVGKTTSVTFNGSSDGSTGAAHTFEVGRSSAVRFAIRSEGGETVLWMERDGGWTRLVRDSHISLSMAIDAMQREADKARAEQKAIDDKERDLYLAKSDAKAKVLETRQLLLDAGNARETDRETIVLATSDLQASRDLLNKTAKELATAKAQWYYVIWAFFNEATLARWNEILSAETARESIEEKAIKDAVRKAAADNATFIKMERAVKDATADAFRLGLGRGDI